MEAMIILYTTKGIKPRNMTKIIEKLFGKTQKSNYGRYEYQIKGEIPKEAYIRPLRATIIIKKGFHQKVINLFNAHGVKFRMFETKVDPDIFKKTEFF